MQGKPQAWSDGPKPVGGVVGKSWHTYPSEVRQSASVAHDFRQPGVSWGCDTHVAPGAQTCTSSQGSMVQ